MLWRQLWGFLQALLSFIHLSCNTVTVFNLCLLQAANPNSRLTLPTHRTTIKVLILHVYMWNHMGGSEVFLYFSCEASAELGMLFYSHDVHEQMFTAAICGHRREPVGLCTYRLHSHIVSQHVACTHWILCSTKCCWFWYYQQWIIVSNWIIYCWK